MGIRRWSVMSAATVMVVSCGAFGAAPAASANQVWHQSIGRASAESPCPTTSAEQLAAGWTQWGPTWEKWPNGETGGWTCTRSITWAIDPPAHVTNARCAAWTSPDRFLWFDGVNALPIGTQLYSDADCTTLSGSRTVYYWAVFAGTREEAQIICDSVIFDHVAFNRLGLDIVLGTNVWACIPTI